MKEIEMKLHYAGTVLLGLGFAMLAGMALIWDPTAPDANIGAGFLVMLGVPIGGLGIALIVAHATYRATQRAQGRRMLHDVATARVTEGLDDGDRGARER